MLSPLSALPISTTDQARRFYVDMGISVETSFDFKLYVAATAGFATRPSDQLRSQPFRAVLDSYSFDVDILGNEIGGFTAGRGSLVISNVDAFYDFLAQDYSIEGQQIVLKAALRSGSYDQSYMFANLTATGWSIDLDKITVDVVDNSYKLEVPMQPNLYGGTGGADGTEDLAGKRKPLCFGYARDVPAVDLVPNLLIRQVNDGSVQDIIAVYDRGSPLTKGTDVASYADLVSSTPAAGSFVTCRNQGLFKLGSVPAGTVTADVQGDNRDGFLTTHADIARWAIRNRTVIADPVDLDVMSFAQTNEAQPAAIDYWLGPDDSITVVDFIANVMGSAGGWGGHNRGGKFEVRIFRAPSGMPVQSFTKSDMLEGNLNREPLPSAYRPPPWRWRVPYARCWTPQTDLAGSVPADRRAFVAQDTRIAEYSNPAIKLDHPFAQDRDPVQAYYSDQTPAAAEAQRRSETFRVQRSIYRFTAPRRALRLKLGDAISVQHDRFDLTQGRLMTVLSMGDAMAFGSNDVAWVRIAAYG